MADWDQIPQGTLLRRSKVTPDSSWTAQHYRLDPGDHEYEHGTRARDATTPGQIEWERHDAGHPVTNHHHE